MASTEQCPKIDQGPIIALGVLCGLLLIGVVILLLLVARIIEGRLYRLDRRRSRRSRSDEYLDELDTDAGRRHRRLLGPSNFSTDTFVIAPELVTPIRTGLGRGPVRYRSGRWTGRANMEAFRDRLRRDQMVHRRGPPIEPPGMNTANSGNQAMQQQPFVQGAQLPAQHALRRPLGAQQIAQHVVMPSPRAQQVAQNSDARAPMFQQPLRQEFMQSPVLQEPMQQEIAQSPRFQPPERQGGMPSPRGVLMSRRNSGRSDLGGSGTKIGASDGERERHEGREGGALNSGGLRRGYRNPRANSTSDRSTIHQAMNREEEHLDHGGSRRSYASSTSQQRGDRVTKDSLGVSGPSRGRGRGINLHTEAEPDASGEPPGSGKGVKGTEDAS